jgi:spermidine/putrescine transport system permease protein
MVMIARLANRGRLGPLVQLGPLTLYMFVFFVVPVGVFLLYSFWAVQEWDVVRVWNLANYRDVFSSPVYPRLILRSLGVGVATAVLSVVVVYPLAYTLAFRLEKYRDLILFLLAISLFSNYVVRIYAWRSILSSNGLVSYILMGLGLADEPRSYLMYTPWAVVLVLLNVYIPFATLPIFSALLNIERDLLDAASDLGANPLRTFLQVTLPLSMPGVVAAFAFIFLLAAGDFVTPELVGGINGMMIGNAVATQFGMVSNWPLGAAMVFSTILVFLLALAALLAVRRAARLVRV